MSCPDTHFNPRSREGSDGWNCITRSFSPKFQSTLPRRERRAVGFAPKTDSQFQSTLPRRERHLEFHRFLLYSHISIHAPAKGATPPCSVPHLVPLTFQSTLPRRERHFRTNHPVHHRAFQSTLPRRERQSSGTGKPRFCLFQSTLPRRERPTSGSIAANRLRFQSTLPRRERPLSPARLMHPQRFQSTLPRRERRALFWCKIALTPISIHAPAKGATCAHVPSISAPQNFNPRSREGSDFIRYRKVVCNGISIHAPAKGATCVRTASDVRRTNFNPRSREGSDFYAITNYFSLRIFQSTLPRRERRI